MNGASSIPQPPPPPGKQAKLLKGALISIDKETSVTVKTAVPFQYNPESLTRSLSPTFYRTQEIKGERTQRLTDAPKQTISLEILLHALITEGTDQQKAKQRKLGILPHLAALELLVNPRSAEIIRRRKLSNEGALAAVPSPDRRVLFIWGPKRVLPVKITSLTITEKLFDKQLQPIYASASVSLELLSFESADADYKLLLSRLQYLENLRFQGKQSGILSEKPTGVTITP